MSLLQTLGDGEGFFGSIITSAMDAIVVVDGDGEILLFNPAAESMFGRAAADITGQPLDILLPGRFHSTHQKLLAHFKEAGQTSRHMNKAGEVYGLHANGREFPVEVTISRSYTGGQILMAAILRDISGRRAMEKALQDAHDKLEQRVAERTAEMRKAIEQLLHEVRERKRIERELRHTNEQLSSKSEQLKEEGMLAKRVLERMVYRGALGERCFRFYVSPLALFNGDILLAARHPAGGYRIMLGDFSGHGLPAAIGGIPVADVFYDSTAKGYLIPHLVAEMNAKLKAVLSAEYFLCACLMDVDPADGKVAIWNGGMPDVVCFGAGSGIRRIGSCHLPLGIVENDDLGLEVHYQPLKPGERICLYSDGLVEARNQDNEMFGMERLEASLRDSDPDQAFGSVIGSLEAFLGEAMYGDDVTLLEIIPGLMQEMTAASYETSA